MKKFLLCHLAILLFSLIIFCEDEIPDRPEDIKFKKLSFKVPDADDYREELKNGAVVYIDEDKELPLVEVSVLIRGGTVFDPKEKEGLIAMMAQLMRTGGTSSLPPNDLNEKLDSLATSVNIYASDSQIHASMSCLSKNFYESLKIIFEILRYPLFNEEKINLYKKQIIENMKSRNDSSRSIEERESMILLYGNHPVNLLPTKKSIESITRQDLFGAHKRFIFPKNMIIAIAGDFERNDVLEKLETLMKDWENRDEKFEFVDVEKEPEPGVYLINKPDVNQARVTIAHLGVKYENPDIYAITLLNYILGGGSFTSRITSRVRSDEGLAYSVYSSFAPGNFWKGIFAIKLQSKSESVNYAIKISLEELKKIIEEGVTEKELEDAKSYYIESLPQKFSSKFATVSLFASQEYFNLPANYYEDYIKNFSKITLQDVKRVAKQYFHPDKLIILIVGNLEEIQKGKGKYAVKFEEFGKCTTIKLPDPLTLQRE